MGKARVDQCLALRLLCVLALVAVGFAHRIPASGGGETIEGRAASLSHIAQAERMAFLLPDGSLPPLCHEVSHSESGRTDAAQKRRPLAARSSAPKAPAEMDKALQAVAYASLSKAQGSLGIRGTPHLTLHPAASTLDDGPKQQGKHGGQHGAAACEACRLSATILLPAPPDLVGLRLRPILAPLLPAVATLPAIQRIPRESQPRAPPVLPA